MEHVATSPDSRHPMLCCLQRRESERAQPCLHFMPPIANEVERVFLIFVSLDISPIFLLCCLCFSYRFLAHSLQKAVKLCERWCKCFSSSGTCLTTLFSFFCHIGIFYSYADNFVSLSIVETAACCLEASGAGVLASHPIAPPCLP